MSKKSIRPADDWRARDDARTLIEAKKILNDPQRHKNAVFAARKMVQEKVEEARAVRNVARQKVSKR